MRPLSTLAAAAALAFLSVAAGAQPVAAGSSVVLRDPASGAAIGVSANPLTVNCNTGCSGGGGGGGAVTATSGAYAAGAIVDVGTGSSPAANTVNANLKTINTTLGAPSQATANAATAPASSTEVGGVAVTGEPTAVTTGQQAALFVDLAGKLVTSPYANRSSMARGGGSTASASAITNLAASGSAGLKEYITALECSNTGASTTIVTLNDGAASIFIVPTGGGTNLTFPVPLAVAANTAATATVTTASTTVYCYAQGFTGY